jgi:hypothetical protein
MKIRAAIIVLMGGLMGAPAAGYAQQPPAIVRINVAPPASQAEVVPAAPSPNHVWISGWWNWDGQRHVWQGGHWELGRPGFTWTPAHWVAEPNGVWAFRAGQWVPYGAPAGVQGTIYSPAAPPAPQVEVIPVAPSPRHHWAYGHWAWNGGRWVWVGGHWQESRAGYYWVGHHWQHLPDGRWVFVEGHWRAY